MKKQHTNKLVLSQETVRNLLHTVRGGDMGDDSACTRRLSGCYVSNLDMTCTCVATEKDCCANTQSDGGTK
jgi:hypothetical protein